MSTNQSIYQQPPPAKQSNIASRPVNNNVSPGFSKPRKIMSTVPNPAYIGNQKPITTQPKNNNLQQEKIDALEKIEEMKDKAETKSADEVSNSTARKYAMIFAAVVLVIAGVVLLWIFYISKSRSGKDCLTSSDAGANVANSSGEWGQSSGKSADSSKS